MLLAWHDLMGGAFRALIGQRSLCQKPILERRVPEYRATRNNMYKRQNFSGFPPA
jgi:hypothetical protein